VAWTGFQIARAQRERKEQAYVSADFVGLKLVGGTIEVSMSFGCMCHMPAVTAAVPHSRLHRYEIAAQLQLLHWCLLFVALTELLDFAGSLMCLSAVVTNMLLCCCCCGGGGCCGCFFWHPLGAHIPPWCLLSNLHMTQVTSCLVCLRHSCT
jgi:hypothetical protein